MSRPAMILLVAGSLATMANAQLTATIEGKNNRLVSAGGTTTFTVDVSGTGPFTYQWQLNGTNLPDNVIITAAGDGTQGYLGDGGVATNLAELGGPQNVVADGAGNIFITDFWTSWIRKVDTNGMISLVVGKIWDDTGSNIWGYSGDGGPATNAALDAPHGLAFDAAGNMFIADSANNCIRKVDTYGIITTVAGNGSYGYSGDGAPATNLSLDYPMDVAVDSAGNLFIADTWNSLIRKVDTNGIMTTVAGYVTDGYILWGFGGDGGPATTAELRFPSSVALDAAGNLFITDTANNRVRKVDTHGIITTVAGDGVEGYSGDGGAAVNAALNTPVGIAVDSQDNLFIADSGNERIREVGSSGIITTVVGNGTNGYSGDGGAPTNATLNSPADVAVDANNNLLIADSDNNVIREVTSSQGPTLTLVDVSKDDQGHYSVIVTGPTGCVTAKAVHLTVLPEQANHLKKAKKPKKPKK